MNKDGELLKSMQVSLNQLVVQCYTILQVVNKEKMNDRIYEIWRKLPELEAKINRIMEDLDIKEEK